MAMTTVQGWTVGLGRASIPLLPPTQTRYPRLGMLSVYSWSSGYSTLCIVSGSNVHDRSLVGKNGKTH